jgi:predicted metal-binding protein
MNQTREDERLKELRKFAINSGAMRAKIIDTKLITVDERVQLKCRYPPCINYGKNLMCPPYTPTAKEFEGIVRKYKNAMLIQLDVPIPNAVKARIKKANVKLVKMTKEGELDDINAKFIEDWKKIHALVSNIERESFKYGYYLSLGLVIGNCRLCDTCDLQVPCKHPYEARPSMEAMGIDVFKTAKNAGLGFEWNSKTTITYNGLILIG